LYVEALLNGLSDIPEVDPSVRETLNTIVEQGRLEALHAELLEGDPLFAASLDATKSQRVVRGLEILRGTGRPLSSFHTPPPLPDLSFQLLILHADRAKLYERINQRVDLMMSTGLLDESRAARSAFPDTGLNAWRTIGYQELLPYLDGQTSLEEATQLIKRNSRRYAKRQLTWYRRYPDAEWIDLDAAPFAETVARLEARFRAS
ncbi:MAG: tRNA dimethylallyltransferase, partial [Bacteroidetes bacterium]|nr:tRNA dimethylallyltransferase [Bacteroidota bacterium]